VVEGSACERVCLSEIGDIGEEDTDRIATLHQARLLVRTRNGQGEDDGIPYGKKVTGR